ncbi:MAG: DUF433 domain-containing protein [Verrucomicrobia bacterium]|nr:DUF433 domain-containing protein [Verrucomicrobiota bacterium]
MNQPVHKTRLCGSQVSFGNAACRFEVNPIWTLESARRQGMTDAAILGAFPTLTAEDLTNAWAYTRGHRDEMDRESAANDDAS